MIECGATTGASCAASQGPCLCPCHGPCPSPSWDCFARGRGPFCDVWVPRSSALPQLGVEQLPGVSTVVPGWACGRWNLDVDVDVGLAPARLQRGVRLGLLWLWLSCAETGRAYQRGSRASIGSAEQVLRVR
jgi:hypothetical protein